jgi:hypothetical protein
MSARTRNWRGAAAALATAVALALSGCGGAPSADQVQGGIDAAQKYVTHDPRKIPTAPRDALVGDGYVYTDKANPCGYNHNIESKWYGRNAKYKEFSTARQDDVEKNAETAAIPFTAGPPEPTWEIRVEGIVFHGVKVTYIELDKDGVPKDPQQETTYGFYTIGGEPFGAVANPDPETLRFKSIMVCAFNPAQMSEKLKRLLEGGQPGGGQQPPNGGGQPTDGGEPPADGDGQPTDAGEPPADGGDPGDGETEPAG